MLTKEKIKEIKKAAEKKVGKTINKEKKHEDTCIRYDSEKK
jgi:hypothetical protein